MSNKRRRRKEDNQRPLLLPLPHLHQYKLLRKGLLLRSRGLLLPLEGNLSSLLVTMTVTVMMIMGSKLTLLLPMHLPISRTRMKR
jgi:hypothetical protein